MLRRADDLAGPGRVIGESAAGHPYTGELRAGENNPWSAYRALFGLGFSEEADAFVRAGHHRRVLVVGTDANIGKTTVALRMARAGVDGITTLSPGECTNHASRL